MTTNDPLPQVDRGLCGDGRNPALPVPDRVEALLAEMTLAEKIGQLGSRWVGNDEAFEGLGQPDAVSTVENLAVAPTPDGLDPAGRAALEEASRHGLGHLTRVYGSRPVTVEAGRRGAGRDAAHGPARLPTRHPRPGPRGVPHRVHHLRSHRVSRCHRLGGDLRSDLVQRTGCGDRAGHAAAGVHQGLAPVLDVVRDYRWGRVEETMGEDPYLVATLGSAYVSGLEGAGVIATLKHFAGYSASRAARNHAPAPIGRRELMDIILPTVRDRDRGRRGPVGDERVLRRRRRSGRRRLLAAHRPAAR